MAVNNRHDFHGFDFYMIEAKPENWIGDRAYDSDPPGRGVAPRRHRDDRATPRQSQQTAYTRSTPSNPLYAPQWQRRILVRWEYHTQNFLAFVQLACLVILFRRF